MGLFEVVLVLFVVLKLVGVEALVGISWLAIFGCYFGAYLTILAIMGAITGSLMLVAWIASKGRYGV